jgi:ADP-heptose:LPS heptosyltransferase
VNAAPRRPAAESASWLTVIRRPGRPRTLEPAQALARELAEPDRVRAILAIKVHDQLGDFLLATPALAALRARYPNALLTLVTRNYLAPLAQRNRMLDRVIVVSRFGDRGAGSGLRDVLTLAGTGPDLAFVLNSVSRSRTADLLAAWSGARLTIGRSRVFAGPVPAEAPGDPFAAHRSATTRDPVYDLDLDVAADSEPQIERYLDLVRWTGAVPGSKQPVLDLRPGEREAGHRALDRAAEQAKLGPQNTRPWVGLHPGAANPLKSWPIDSFIELAARLAPAVRLAVFDSPKEPGRAAAVQAGLEGRALPVAFIPAGGIADFAAACAALDLLVCNDSGVLHVASALGIPTLSFHSLGRPEEWAPRSAIAIALFDPQDIAAIAVGTAEAAARRLLSSLAS